MLFNILLIILLIILCFILVIKKKNYFKCEILENYSINTNIPKNIYLTYKTKDIPKYVIKNWEKLNPDYNIYLFDNDDCIKFLNDNYGKLFVDIFNFIKDGPIKSDFWRCCIMYKYGGVYSDADMKPLVAISDIVKNNNKINFYTCQSMSNIESVNPTIIISIKNHKILHLCILKYIEKYKNKEKYEYWRYSIAIIMYDSIKKYLNINKTFGNKVYDDILLFQEKGNSIIAGNNYDNYIEYNSKKLFNNRYNNYDSLKHEFKN